MSNLWAYFNIGDNHYQRLGWKRNLPEGMPTSGGLTTIRDAVYEPIRNLSSWRAEYPGNGGMPEVGPNAFKGQHFIAFDGARWHVGYGGGPNSFLDAEKYPAHIYSCEGLHLDPGELPERKMGERATHWLHGHTSMDSTFPEQIPHLDKAALAALHEEHVIPHWLRGHYTDTSPIPQWERTAYAPHSEVPHVTLAEHLPADAIEKLREAHAQGKPVMLAYDGATKTVTDVSGRYSSHLRLAAQETTRAKSVSGTEPKPAATTRAHELTTGKSASAFKDALSFKTAAGEIRWGKVTGVAAGVVLAGGAALILLHKKDPNETWTGHTASRQATGTSQAI